VRWPTRRARLGARTAEDGIEEEGARGPERGTSGGARKVCRSNVESETPQSVDTSHGPPTPTNRDSARDLALTSPGLRPPHLMRTRLLGCYSRCRRPRAAVIIPEPSGLGGACRAARRWGKCGWEPGQGLRCVSLSSPTQDFTVCASLNIEERVDGNTWLAPRADVTCTRAAWGGGYVLLSCARRGCCGDLEGCTPTPPKVALQKL